MSTDRDAATARITFRYFVVGGTVLTAAVVASAGAIGPPRFAAPFTSWGGLLAQRGVWPDEDRWPGIALAVALCAFAALWLAAARTAHVRGWSPRRVWIAGAAWMAPLVAGPPILSNDVFSYVAQGAVAAGGADPTTVPSYELGWASPFVRAVDPIWRGTPSPYGPFATLLQRSLVEAAGAHPVLAVVAMRLIAAVSVAGIAALALSIHRALSSVGATSSAMTRREASILMMVWANPLLSLHVVAAIHLEGVLVLFVLLAVRLVMVRTPGADLAAVVCAATAAAVKLPVGAVVVAAVGAVVVARSDTAATGARRATAAIAAAAGTYATVCALAGSGWNVLAVVTAPSQGRTPAAPATLLASALTPLRWIGTTETATLATVGRFVCAPLAMIAIGYLLVTARRRPAATTTGLALLALAAGSPVLYPWYLVWSVPLLAVVATGAWRRRLVIGSALGAVMTVQGLTHLETWALASTIVTTAVVVLWRTEAGLRGLLVEGVRSRVPARWLPRAALER